MGKYQRALEHYLEHELRERPPWDLHIPDELYAQIDTFEDFKDFIKFVADDNRDSNLFDVDVLETDVFLQRLSALFESDDIKKMARDLGVETDLGYLALVIGMALGEG